MAANEAEMDYGVEDLKQNMIGLFEHRESADFTLVCGSQTFKIHSFILCPRSTFSRAALEGGFKEGLAKRIELLEDNPLLISQLIYYCYTTEYSFGQDTALAMGPEHALRFPINLHAGMYAIAEKFDLKNLKKLAKQKFVRALHRLEPGINVATPGDQTLTRVLEVVCFIYSTTLENDSGLRDIVVGTFIAAHTDFIIEVIEAKKNFCSRCKKHAAWKKECSSLAANPSNDGW